MNGVGSIQKQITEMLYTLLDAETQLYNYIINCNIKEKEDLYGLCMECLWGIKVSVQGNEEYAYKDLSVGCENLLYSIENCRKKENTEEEAKRVEFELFPMTKVVLARFYFFTEAVLDRKKTEEFYETGAGGLLNNEYVEKSEESGQYKYDLSIVVTGYNKLEYTKMCVESILQQYPKDLKAELILYNHGSNDGTKEYFESICPTKQVDIKLNGRIGIVPLIFEGKYLLGISNDVIVTKNALANMYDYMEEHSEVAWAVPSTSNVSNLQSIHVQYSSFEELNKFAEVNNQKNEYRQEYRCRLCNPLDIKRANVYFYSKGIKYINRVLVATDQFSFPDDRQSLFLRRAGYKMALIKNAYCHHFGSVTLKEATKFGYYNNGRNEFIKEFGIDPWGPGMCYDYNLFEKLVCKGEGHIDVLGINCGLGSNPLKVKEELKERSHNIDVTLHVIVNDKAYIDDLKGIADVSDVYNSTEELFDKIGEYDYILLEERVEGPDKNIDVLKRLFDILKPQGILIVNNQPEIKELVGEGNCVGECECVDEWIVLRKKGNDF